jgi:murein DD-endopeptidase MepM/ murein hydrolase activator NlpD
MPRVMLRRLAIPIAAAAALVLSGCETPPPPATPTTTVPRATVDVDTVRPLTFPVIGKVSFVDSFGAPRSGGRTHQGTDLMGAKMLKLVAAADGTVTALRHDNTGLSGNSLTITDADGWSYVYIHINNDTPGTDDGKNVYDQAFASGIRKGTKVTAGQHVAFMGDSGNAENAGSHLHFELHAPDGTVVNPYHSLITK